MGAHSFETTIFATNLKSFHRAFEQESEQDRYENGHDCYSGSIGQKSGARMVVDKPITEEQYRQLIEETGWGDKWDSVCFAAPIAEVKLVGKAKTKTAKFVAADASEARDMALAKYGSENARVKVVSTTCLRGVSYKLEKVESQKGWRVKVGWDEVHFETKSLALAFYKEQLLAGKQADMLYKDQQYKRVVKKKAQFEITVEIQKTKVGTKISHYNVWGMAAC